MGGLKTREAHLSNEDVLSFSQLKHNKKYSVPQNFLPQTRVFLVVVAGFNLV